MKKLYEEVVEALNQGEMKTSLDFASEAVILGIGIANPISAAILSIIKKAGNSIDDFKINILIKQLGDDLNVETLRNELVNYISDNDKKAMIVVDIFRKSLLSESIIAITVMGIILGKMMKKTENPSMCDMIIYKALDNATDKDLTIFYSLIDSQKVKNEKDMTSDEILTCEWCMYNRIFKKHVMEWNVEEDYTNTEVSQQLYLYIKEVPTYLLKL